MALKQDERALLQLICERGQSYGDLAELLGISEDQVRERARAALRELADADPDADVGLTDYLLGQADPIGRADAVRHLQQDPEARELAATIATKLKAIAPAAELPTLPDPRGKRRRTAVVAEEPAAQQPVAAEPAAPPPEQRAQPQGRQARLIAGAVGGAVVLVFAILAIAGAFSGDETEAPAEDALAEAQREVTSVELSPSGGSGVAGRADFGLANDQLFVDLSVEGLDPELDEDSVYVLWLMLNPNGGYPVSIIVPGDNGGVQDRYAVPTPVAVAVASNARAVQISESPSRQLRRDINEAVESGAPLVPFEGDVLARGRIPLAEGAEGEGEGGVGAGAAGAEPDGAQPGEGGDEGTEGP